MIPPLPLALLNANHFRMVVECGRWLSNFLRMYSYDLGLKYRKLKENIRTASLYLEPFSIPFSKHSTIERLSGSYKNVQ